MATRRCEIKHSSNCLDIVKHDLRVYVSITLVHHRLVPFLTTSEGKEAFNL